MKMKKNVMKQGSHSKKVQSDAILDFRQMIGELKKSSEKISSSELLILAQSSLFCSGSNAEVVFIPSSSELVVKRGVTAYIWDVSKIVK
jgi:hypothetical protein